MWYWSLNKSGRLLDVVAQAIFAVFVILLQLRHADKGAMLCERETKSIFKKYRPMSASTVCTGSHRSKPFAICQFSVWLRIILPEIKADKVDFSDSIAPPGWLRVERVGLITWWLWFRSPVKANLLSGVFYPLTSAEASEKSSRCAERKVLSVLVWESQKTHMRHRPPWYDLSC